jgi:hypothetical protein
MMQLWVTHTLISGCYCYVDGELASASSLFSNFGVQKQKKGPPEAPGTLDIASRRKLFGSNSLTFGWGTRTAFRSFRFAKACSPSSLGTQHSWVPASLRFSRPSLLYKTPSRFYFTYRPNIKTRSCFRNPGFYYWLGNLDEFRTWCRSLAA